LTASRPGTMHAVGVGPRRREVLAVRPLALSVHCRDAIGRRVGDEDTGVDLPPAVRRETDSRLLAAVKVDYTDTSHHRPPTYRVTAVNAQGEGRTAEDSRRRAGRPRPRASCLACWRSRHEPRWHGQRLRQNTPPDPSVNVRISPSPSPTSGRASTSWSSRQMTPSSGTLPASSQWYIVWTARRLRRWKRPQVRGDEDRRGRSEEFRVRRFRPSHPTDGSVPPPTRTRRRPWAMPISALRPGQRSHHHQARRRQGRRAPLGPGDDLAALNVRTTWRGPTRGRSRRQRVRHQRGTAPTRWSATPAASADGPISRPARLAASPTHGHAPLTVGFDGSSSSDPDAGTPSAPTRSLRQMARSP